MANLKHEVGERKGSLEFIEYAGYGNSHEDYRGKNGNWIRKAQHWWRVRCDCGNEEVLYVDILRGRTACAVCMSDARWTVNTPRRLQREQVPPELDFARLKLR